MNCRLIFAISVLAMLPACNHEQKQQPSALGVAAEGKDHIVHLKQKNWEYMTDTAVGIAMIHIFDSRNAFVLSCRDFDFELFSSELKPLNQWSQPEFGLQIGTAKASKIPDVQYGRPHHGLKIRFKIQKDMLAAIRSGKDIAITLGPMGLSFPAPPAQLREEFAKQCADPNSPAMGTSYKTTKAL